MQDHDDVIIIYITYICYVYDLFTYMWSIVNISNYLDVSGLFLYAVICYVQC